MIQTGQMNSGKLAHNGSFVVMLPVGETGAEVGVKLVWGDFEDEYVKDMTIAVKDPHIATMLLVQGWTVGTGEAAGHVATIPVDTEIYVMPEQESYWHAKARNGLTEDPGPGNMSYPAEGKMFKPLYVRTFAMGIWKNSQYTPVNTDWKTISDARRQWETEHGEE